MQLFNPFRSVLHVGLDIQPHEIRLLALKNRRHNPSVLHVSRVALPAGAVQDGKIQQLAVVQACLAGLVKATQSAGRNAAIALPIYSIISKKIQLTAGLSEAEQGAEIAANLGHYFPGVSDELCFDYVLLNQTDGPLLFCWWRHAMSKS